jgi:hypothetical protein
MEWLLVVVSLVCAVFRSVPLICFRLAPDFDTKPTTIPQTIPGSDITTVIWNVFFAEYLCLLL